MLNGVPIIIGINSARNDAMKYCSWYHKKKIPDQGRNDKKDRLFVCNFFYTASALKRLACFFRSSSSSITFLMRMNFGVTSMHSSC